MRREGAGIQEFWFKEAELPQGSKYNIVFCQIIAFKIFLSLGGIASLTNNNISPPGILNSVRHNSAQEEETQIDII